MKNDNNKRTIQDVIFGEDLTDDDDEDDRDFGMSCSVCGKDITNQDCYSNFDKLFEEYQNVEKIMNECCSVCVECAVTDKGKEMVEKYGLVMSNYEDDIDDSE